MASGAAKPTLPTEIRAACREVARRARSVRIEDERIPLYAATLPDPLREESTLRPRRAERERRAAFWLTLDAINFGSGWFPTLHKRPGRSGYATVSGGVRGRFEHAGPWSAAELADMTSGEIAGVVGQDPGHELMELFATSLRHLGRRVETGYDGSFLGVVEDADGSAVTLVGRLATWPCFADHSAYEELEVPFLKRAQIAAADLARAGAASFDDLDELTMFADNLVPHVLRLDGILRFAPDLVQRIERETALVHGSPEEVEIRACAVHAVELIVSAVPEHRAPADIDQILWHRGQGRTYKARPRHRARCTAY